MTQVLQVTVSEAEDGQRLDRWFRAHFPALTHGRLEKLLRKGQVRVDGGRVKANARLTAGQVVRVPPLNVTEEGEGEAPPKPARKPVVSEKDANWLRSLVLHQDDDVIVINKPAGLAVQGGTKTEKHLDGMLDALQFGAPERPKLVHRLDRDTSGVLVLARSAKAAAALGEAFKAKETRKLYWALTVGVPKPSAGRIDLALSKLGGQGRERVHVVEEGDEDAKRAATDYAVQEAAGQKLAFVAMMPVTGRTHQLRAHMSAIGCPIVGDGKYGGAAAHPGGEIPRALHLHARALLIPHPKGGVLKVVAPLPPHMRTSWKLLGLSDALPEDPFDLSA